MPEKRTLERARKAKRQGKSPTTQAGEFVREEIHHIREGKHGARSTEQAIAIGLSKARRAGVRLKSPRRGTVSEQTREQAARDASLWRRKRPHKPSARRSRAMHRKLEQEGHAAASTRALSEHARRAARRRSPAERRAAARKAARSRSHEERSQSARKAARTRKASHHATR